MNVNMRLCGMTITRYIPSCGVLLMIMSLTSMAYTAVIFHDDFSRYRHGEFPRAQWIGISGDWQVRHGELRCAERRMAIVYASGSPLLREQVLEVNIQVHQRTIPTGYAHAGLMLFSDAGDFWRLGLVEDPDHKTRRMELLENYHNIWQAQSTRRYLLPNRRGGKSRWVYGRWYRLRLIVTRKLLRGEVLDGRNGELLWWSEYELLEHVPAVRMGRLGLQCAGLDVSFDEAKVVGEMMEFAQLRDGRNRIAIFADELPSLNMKFARRLAIMFERAGYDVAMIDANELANSRIMQPTRFGMLALPSAHEFPIAALPAFEQYLRDGGMFIAFGREPFKHFVHRLNGQWLPIEQALQHVKPT
ncbi:MAG TPA: hypothetical protein EYP10_13135, partial [Armatimonadetes bacterium]|nr:hypothetical protein [Armatimonadota bacterium]